MMAKAMQLQPHLLELHLHLKPGLAEGKKDDVKKIWATVGLRRFELFRTKEDVVGEDKGYSVEKPDDDWDELEKILDMSEPEFERDPFSFPFP